MISMHRLLLLGAAFALNACTMTASRHEHSAAPQFFHIEPVRPVAELLPIALAATPPVEPGEFRPADLVELKTLDPTIKLDIRYATARNFLGTPLYSQARAFMQRPAAEALMRVQRALAAEGYGLLIHDAYRPWYVTKIFWDATPVDKHDFVADPATGSRHNRGCAVDLTLYTLRDGRTVEMPSLYDEMSERAYPTMPAQATRRVTCATCCVNTWKQKALRSTNSSGGISTTATGSRMRFRISASKT